jgi:hypothetical protein
MKAWERYGDLFSSVADRRTHARTHWHRVLSEDFALVLYARGDSWEAYLEGPTAVRLGYVCASNDVSAKRRATVKARAFVRSIGANFPRWL